MKYALLLPLIVVLLTSSLVAQDSELPELEIITPENADRLVELVHWESVGDNGFAAATFSPDGQILALAINDGTIQLLDPHTLRRQRVLEGADFAGTQVQFSPDGRRLLLSDWVGNNRLWDVESGEILREYTPHPDDIWSVADPNLQTLAVQRSTNNTDDSVSVIDLNTGEIRIQLGPVDPFLAPN